MNYTNYRLSLDIFKTSSQATLPVKQGDTAYRLCITITANGAPYHITEGCYAHFTAKKPDGNFINNKCTIENDTIYYQLTPQTTAAIGVVECEIVLYDNNDEQLATPPFNILVDAKAYNGEKIESSSEVNMLEDLIAESEAQIAEVEEKLANGEFKGEKGDKGDKGEQGIQGEKGEKGEDGKDAITDQTYSPTSENAQSGKAVEQAIMSQYEGKNINLMSVYDKQEGLISSPSNSANLPFYANANWWTVTIPLNADEYEKYYLATNHSIGTSLRWAFLDENENYITNTYSAKSVPNGKPLEIDATLYSYIVISIDKTRFEELTLCGGKVLSGDPYYELLPNVAPNYNSFFKYIFSSSLNKVLGKKLGVLGDSITKGSGVTDKKWWEYVTERYGFSATQANAEAGRAFSRDGSESTRFTVKVTELDADCDVIIVFGGVNDFGFDTPIGTIDDIATNDNRVYTDTTDKVTFYSSVKYVMEYLTTNFVNSKIIFFTPLPKNNKEIFNLTNAAGHKLNDYVEALKIMARTYGIDLVDTNAVGEFYVYNTNWLATYMPDGIHPNDAGTEVYVKNAIFPSLDKLFIKAVNIDG